MDNENKPVQTNYTKSLTKNPHRFLAMKYVEKQASIL
jgi:hypothetical protein